MTPATSARRIHLLIDPWIEARRSLDESIRQHPGFADLRHLLGLLLLEQKEWDPALAEFEAALAANPGYRQARFGRLVALRLRDGSLDPVLWSREGPIQGAEEPERSLWTAWFLAQAGDEAGTRAALEHLTDMPEWVGLGRYVLAVYSDCWNNGKGTQEALALAARAHPLFDEILRRRGLVGPRNPAGGPRPPLAEGSEAAGWNPGAASLYEHLGTICARHGRPEGALEFYEEAFLRQGRESLHQARLAQLALARGDEDAAVRALLRAIEVDPSSVQGRIALGFEYQSQGFQEEALVQFEVAARLRPDYPDVQYNLGLLYDGLGRSKEAKRCLRQALAVNPNYYQARTTLAQSLIRSEAWTEALEELSQLIAQGVRSADLHVQKAQALLSLDRVPEAVDELEQAVAVNPSYAWSYYVLGRAYRQLGLRRKARSAWQQYLECSRTWREQQPVHEGDLPR